MLAVDYTGIGALIGAITAAIIAVVNLVRQSRTHAVVQETEKRVDKVYEQVNGAPVDPRPGVTTPTLGEQVRELRTEVAAIRRLLE